jgi:hypothetical protein
MSYRRMGWCSGLCALALLPAAVAAQAEPIQLAALTVLDDADPGMPPSASALDCLALNIYWEARAEPRLGQIAVAEVTLNRVADPAFPATVCAVVRQGEERGHDLCQFSWHCDGLDDRPRNPAAWQDALRLALLALTGRLPDPTDGALWFHSDEVHPDWPQLAPIVKIGSHIFYRAAPAPGERRATVQGHEGPPVPPGEKPAPPVRMAAAEVMPKVAEPVPGPSDDPVPAVGRSEACDQDLGVATGGPDLMRALATASRDEFLALVDQLRRNATRERAGGRAPCADARPGGERLVVLVPEALQRHGRGFTFAPILAGNVLAAVGEPWTEPLRLPRTFGAATDGRGGPAALLGRLRASPF